MKKRKKGEGKKNKWFISAEAKKRKEMGNLDMMERMIRVEQKIAASFGKYIPYEDTIYYNSLSMSEKQNFESYLKKSRRKKVLFAFALISGLSLIAGLKLTLTGKVAQDNLPDTGLIGNILILAVLAGLIYLASSVIEKRRSEKILDRNFKIIQDIISKKRNKKKIKK